MQASIQKDTQVEEGKDLPHIRLLIRYRFSTRRTGRHITRLRILHKDHSQEHNFPLNHMIHKNRTCWNILRLRILHKDHSHQHNCHLHHMIDRVRTG